MAWGVERLSFGSQGNRVPTITLLFDRGHILEERQDIVPLNVVIYRVIENLLHRRPVVPIEF
jgi:hypothetical protein